MALLLLILADLTIRRLWFRGGEQKIASEARTPAQSSETPQPAALHATPPQADVQPDPAQSESRADSNIEASTSLRYLLQDQSAVFGPTFSPDGHFAVAGTATYAAMWDVETGNEIRRFQVGSALALAFSPDGASILSVNEQQVVQLLDVQTGKEIYRFQRTTEAEFTELVFVARFSPDGLSAMTASINGLIQVWDLHRGSEVRRLKLPSALEPLNFSPDGHLVLQCNMARGINVVNTGTGSKLHTFDFDPAEDQIAGPTGHLHVLSACFSADGRRILLLDGDPSGGTDTSFLRLVDLDTGKKLRSFSLRLRTDGQIAFSRDDHSVLISGAAYLVLCKLP